MRVSTLSVECSVKRVRALHVGCGVLFEREKDVVISLLQTIAL